MNVHILPLGPCALTVFPLIFIDFSCALFRVDVWELDVAHILLCILFGDYLGKFSFNCLLKSFIFEKFMNVYSEVYIPHISSAHPPCCRLWFFY